MTTCALNRRKAFRKQVLGPPLWWGEEVEMKKVCAWCQQLMNDSPEKGLPISHGICDRCVELALKKGIMNRRPGSAVAAGRNVPGQDRSWNNADAGRP
jgi:hypothetical protein